MVGLVLSVIVVRRFISSGCWSLLSLLCCPIPFLFDILVLDEWLSAGDAAFVQKAGERMQRMVEEAKIVVLATHDEDLVQRVCNRVCELSGGRIAFLGSTEDWVAYRAAAAA